MKNLNEELRNLNEYDYKVSTDFSKKVMKKIRRNHLLDSMKYVVSWVSIGAVACFAVVIYTNPNLKLPFFKGAAESQDFALLEDKANASVNNSSMNDSFESIKDSNTNSFLQIYEDSKELNRIENSIDNKMEFDAIISENEKQEIPETSIKETAGASQANKIESLIQKLSKAGFVVTKVENGLKINASKEEKEKLQDLLKDEDVELEEQKEQFFIKLP